MPKLPQQRIGSPLIISGRPLEFSFWPMEKTTRRYGLGTRVFATDPWTVIWRVVELQCPANSKKAAFALLEQAKDFYHASASGVKAAKPLLLYYCFLNLTKAYLLTIKRHHSVDNAQHGLSVKLDDPPNDKELINAFLEAHKSPGKTGLNLFDELLTAISGSGLSAGATRYNLTWLMPQIVPGHRLWVAGNKVRERFISIEKIDFYQDSKKKKYGYAFFCLLMI